jgi:hypothetical protein
MKVERWNIEFEVNWLCRRIHSKYIASGHCDVRLIFVGTKVICAPNKENHRLVSRPWSRDSDFQFTWELLRRIPEVHIYLDCFVSSLEPDNHPRRSLWSMAFLEMQTFSSYWNCFTFSWSPYFSLELLDFVDLIVFCLKIANRQEVVTYRLADAFGPCTRSNSVVPMNCVTTKQSFRISEPKSTQLLHHFICPHHLSLF